MSAYKRDVGTFRTRGTGMYGALTEKMRSNLMFPNAGYNTRGSTKYYTNNKPNAIICHTIKGKGFPFAESNPSWHHKSSMSKADMKAMKDCISKE